MSRSGKTKHIFASVFLAVFIFVSAAPQAVALTLGGLNNVPVYDQAAVEALSDTSMFSFLPGGDSVRKTLFSKIDTANKACAKAEVGLETASTASSLISSGLSMISGNKVEVAQLKARILKLAAAIKCREAVLTSLAAYTPATIFEAQKAETLKNEATRALASLKQRKDQAEDQHKIATKSVWKAILIPLMMTASKKVATSLINNLTDKYKINDYMKYADAVAGQAYAATAISQQAKDNRDMLLVQNFMTNPLAKKQVQPLLKTRIDDAITFNGQKLPVDSKKIDFTENDFYEKMTSYGKAETLPAFVLGVMDTKAQTAQAKAVESAKVEIGASAYKNTHDCRGDLAAQDRTNAELKKLQDEYADRSSLFDRYQQVIDTAKLGSKERQEAMVEQEKVFKELETITAKLKAFPVSKTNPVEQVCKGIVNPQSTVNKMIDSAFKKFAPEEYFAENNMPAAYSYITNFGSDIIAGFLNGKSPKQSVLSEVTDFDFESLNPSVFKQPDQTPSEDGETPANPQTQTGAIFTIVSDPAKENGYNMQWSAKNVNGAASVRVSVLSAPNGYRLPYTTKMFTELQVPLVLNYAGAYNFKLSVLDSTDKEIVSTTRGVSVEPKNGTDYASLEDCVEQIGDQAYCSSLLGSGVLGAKTKNGYLPIRGFQGIAPRGY